MKVLNAFIQNFLGSAPVWYKITIVAFLILNPFLLLYTGPFVTGWIIMAEFIFTLAMSLSSYPLLAGGLIAIETWALKMVSSEQIYSEVEHNFPVLLLLMFMVAAIYFMREMLLVVFSNLLVLVKSKLLLSLLFCFLGAFLSAFLDALTVISVVISVAVGFFAVYHRYASERGEDDDHDHTNDAHVKHQHHAELEQFRAFLQSLLMHAAVGTALGGVMTQVGEPQNVIIANIMEWDFVSFFLHVAPVSVPVLFAGLLTCFGLERFYAFGRFFGYGVKLPNNVRNVIRDFVRKDNAKRDAKGTARLIVQGISALLLITGLALHIAEVGLIGLTMIVLQTAFNGVNDEHRIGHAFTESLPFAALLVVFFAIVGMIHQQGLFEPVIEWTLSFEGTQQLLAYFVASGGLSAISDNVFVATIYISEAEKAFNAGQITREQYELIAVAINTGTNIPSVATPNGQAAFLFLLTSPIAKLIQLKYTRMIKMALPYTVTMTATALVAVAFFL